jgi:hypothetical protein
MTQVGFIQFDETATYVTGYGNCLDKEETLWFKKVPDPYAVRNYYISDGAFIERPSSPVPFEIEGGYRIEGCPPNSHIIIQDCTSGELIYDILTLNEEDNFLEFTFEDPGAYQVRVTSPLPHHETVTDITKVAS